MNTKYFEHIVVYLSVLVVCVIIALFARVVALRLGVDEFTAQIVFWSVVAIGIIIYSILSILVEGLFTALVKFFFPKKQGEKTNDNASDIEAGQVVDGVGGPSSEQHQQSMDFDSIRQQQQKLMDQKVQDKRAIAIKYTQQQFAPYVSDKDLLRLCKYIELYSAKLPLSHVEPINIKGLVALDLFHFGWNIWNHFRVGKQDEISQFLKQVFAITFKDVEVGSIKSHLRDDEKKGTIPIVQSLSDHQITE